MILEINDDGPGIAEEVQAKIFDPFFTTKEVGKGTGLGLTVAYAIVNEHGGRIRLESRPGFGASFFVELPVTGARLPPTPSPRPRPAHAAGPEHATILVVDDEAALAAAVCAALQDAGFAVEQASDGEQALMRVQSRPFDLVICDLKMPRVDGRTFYGMLSATKPAMSQRVIFVTGDVAGTDAETFLEDSGAAGWRSRSGSPTSYVRRRKCSRKADALPETRQRAAATAGRTRGRSATFSCVVLICGATRGLREVA